MRLSFNLFVIAAMALALTACGGESSGASRAETELSEKASAVETNATNSTDPALNTAVEPAADAFVIVMLGDSLTAGLGLNDNDAPPAQIEKRLNAGGVAVRVINAGVSGDTTANGLARFDWSVTSANPDLLVVALGANDYFGGVEPARAKENLAAIIERAKALGVPVALVGVKARSSAAADARGAEYSAIYPELAAAHNTPLYPAMLKGVRGVPGFLQADGLHPTAEGAAIIADNLTGFLAPIIATLDK